MESRNIPSKVTTRDLFILIAEAVQKVDNIQREFSGVREELAMERRHMVERIEANNVAVRKLRTDLDRLTVSMEKLEAWQDGHGFTCPFAGMSSRAANRVYVANLLQRHFDMAELNDLIFRLDINPEEVRGETLPAKVQALVGFLIRRGRMFELLEICRELRPEAEWPAAWI